MSQPPEDAESPYPAVPVPRYNPVRVGDESDAYAVLRFRRVVGIGFGVWFGYLTIRRLGSPYPIGAISTLIVGVFLSYDVIWPRKFGARILGGLGVASAIGIAVLWTAANLTGERTYHREAVGFSVWGGAIVLIAVLAVAYVWGHWGWKH